MTYRIRENEFSYDDIYNNIEEARKVVEKYLVDDIGERNIAYYIVDEDSQVVESFNC